MAKRIRKISKSQAALNLGVRRVQQVICVDRIIGLRITLSDGREMLVESTGRYGGLKMSWASGSAGEK